MSLLSALTDLKALAATVDGLVVYDLGATVTPPGVVFGMPTLAAETFTSGITEMTVECYLIAALDDYFLDTLLGQVDALLLALESAGSAVVTGIQPGEFTLDGGPALPSYALTVQIPIDGD